MLLQVQGQYSHQLRHDRFVHELPDFPPNPQAKESGNTTHSYHSIVLLNTYTFCRIWTLAPSFFIQCKTGAFAGFTTAYNILTPALRAI